MSVIHRSVIAVDSLRKYILINEHQSISLLPACIHTLILQLYVYLRLTTVVEPDLQLAKSEQVFVDPHTGGSTPFPRTAHSPPSLYLSLVVPAYKEQNRCKVECACAVK